jgi:hypothetical protein
MKEEVAGSILAGGEWLYDGDRQVIQGCHKRRTWR